MIVPVLLSGGVGSRLWPVSRESHPKQFLPLGGEKTMLQETLLRLAGLETAPPLVVANEEHRFMVAEQLRQIDVKASAIVLEPDGRNTAPAVALAALKALESDPDAMLLVLPADHVIKDSAAFVEAVNKAAKPASQGLLMTFGVVPDKPETGYGYIRFGEQQAAGHHGLEEFVEKPDQATAESYVNSGNYLWNSGMFLLRGDSYLKELAEYSPAILDSCKRALTNATVDLDFTRPDADIFAQCPSDSIDYAVMERTITGGVIPLDCGWSDVGAWSALWDVAKRDSDDNAIVGDVLAVNSQSNYLHAEHRLLAVTDVSDLVVVETADAVLVGKRDSVQNVKLIVNQLKQLNRGEASTHRRVYRPWGSYEGLETGDRFQVKRIFVDPGQTLSLQKHHHRAEHWIVVSGTAEVTCGDKVFMMTEDESTYIPLGHKHRLANPGRIPLEVIEVQSGSYLGEDDIVRYDDVYGRSE